MFFLCRLYLCTNQSTNYYTFIMYNCKTKISVRLLLDCVISNFITDITSTTFLQGGRYLLLLIFEDIYNMYQQYLVEILVNPTCVLPQSASVDGTADRHCLQIDPSKNGKLATTISCYDYLSCKS